MTGLSRHDRYRLSLYRRLTGRWRVLPDFIILGVQKAGTTTIYDNLVKHPAVHPCDIKEVHYFDTNWAKGKNWYRGHFATSREKAAALAANKQWVTGEGSPYYIFHPLAPERLKSICPDAKLIVVLRNPVERAYSHFQHEKRKGREPLSFEEAIADEEKRLEGEADRITSGAAASSFSHQHYSYKARGYYADQLSEWFRHFPREQFLILENSVLNTQFDETFQKLYNFIGVELLNLEQPRRSNVGNYEKINPETRARLAEHFAPHNQRLYELLGHDFEWA